MTTLAALDPVSGTADLAWAPRVTSDVMALASNSNALIAGGGFSTVANLPQATAVRLFLPAGLVAVGDPEPPAADDTEWARVSPNPTLGVARVEYLLPRASQVRVSVYDVHGRMRARPVDAFQPPGRHITTWNAAAEGLAPGLYFLRFEGLGRDATRRLVLIR